MPELDTRLPEFILMADLTKLEVFNVSVLLRVRVFPELMDKTALPLIVSVEMEIVVSRYMVAPLMSGIEIAPETGTLPLLQLEALLHLLSPELLFQVTLGVANTE